MPILNRTTMNFRKLGIIFSSAVFLGLPFQVFAEDVTVSVTPGQTRQEERGAKREESKQNIADRRKQMLNKMKGKLVVVVEKMNKMAQKLHEHVDKLRNRAAEFSKNRGTDTSRVETALVEAERHIGLAETGIADLKSKLSGLESTTTPKNVAQTFRTGVQSIHIHFKDARENLVVAVKALKDVAKETRPTKGVESPR